MERRPAVDFTSGYFQRAMDRLPRQGSRKPWRIHQNYVQDIFALRIAAVDDGVAARTLLAEVESEAFPRLHTIYADNKYHNHELLAWVETSADYRIVVVRRPADSVGFVKLPQRWVVERTIAWLSRSRRLSKRLCWTPGPSRTT